MSSLSNNAEYYILFTIKDIFDQTSNFLTASFIKGTIIGLESRNTKNEFSVYPNPFDHEINIRSDHTSTIIGVELSNILGEVILKQEISTTSEIRIPLDVDCGIYILNVLSEKGKRTYKLLKGKAR